jgi:hypothetical protein
MATKSLEERIQKLESAIEEVQQKLAYQPVIKMRGWRWFVGVDAGNPHFEEAVRLGREWRYSDRPADED